MKNIINRIYHNRFFGWLFHTTIHCLKRELKDCESVLDLGCGPSSPLQYCKNIKYSVGVEPFDPYFKKTRKRAIHTHYLAKKIEDLNFPERSFDAIILIEVVEHLPKQAGLEIIKKAEKWAKKKVIVSTPNDFLEQPVYDDNVFQKHLSGWSKENMEKLGFYCKGLAGLKLLRQGMRDNIKRDDFMASIRFKPRFFWFIMATLSQLLAYHIPSLAFELFCVKKIK
jgi:SAM-dependent methyltransferase